MKKDAGGQSMNEVFITFILFISDSLKFSTQCLENLRHCFLGVIMLL
jgi:hypothetical protein